MSRTRPARIPLAMEDAICFYPSHSHIDRAAIIAILEEAKATGAYHLSSGCYVGFTNARGEVVAYLRNTRFTLTQRAPVTIDRDPRLGQPSFEVLGGWDLYLSTNRVYQRVY